MGIGGEYAAIAAFVVFAGTTSRGDLLSRGSQRVIGTIGSVLAGMGLALVVGDRADGVAGLPVRDASPRLIGPSRSTVAMTSTDAPRTQRGRQHVTLRDLH